MSDTKKKNEAPEGGGWKHLKSVPDIKGPPKPWDPEVETAAEEIVSFIKDPTIKRQFHNFLTETYKRFSEEKIGQTQARLENESEVDNRGSLSAFHKAGNITPIMAETFNMNQSEQAFARGLKGTHSHLTRHLEERVEEINRLLSGLGGFSSQLKSCFARSTVVFLEQEDPQFPFRERLIFSINLPNYELKRCWDRNMRSRGKKEKAAGEMSDDPRTVLQATWDDAVNSLAQIIASVGLKPKYCKNDRHYGRFVMKQDLRSGSHLPDEYFSFTLDYNTAERIQEMCGPYDKIVREYDKKIGKLNKKLAKYQPESKATRCLVLKKKHFELCQERDFFVGTTPDPNQLDEGLLFLIEVSTLKDYHIVKDRMQSIMTKYILHLSKLAVKDAEIDPDLEYEMWRTNSKNGKKPDALTLEMIESIPEYVVSDGGTLQKVEKKKKAA